MGFIENEERGMRRHQVKEMIADGESDTVEFKRKCVSAEKIARELIAFANSGGGFLLVGVDDDGKIVGVESEKTEIAVIMEACQQYIRPAIEPEIHIVNFRREDVIVVEVAESQLKPHRLVFPDDGQDHANYYDSVFVRQGEASVQASKELAKVLEAQNPDAQPVTLSIGRHEKTVFEFLDSHPHITVSDFARISKIPEPRAAKLLVRLVRAGALNINQGQEADFYTLVG